MDATMTLDPIEPKHIAGGALVCTLGALLFIGALLLAGCTGTTRFGDAAAMDTPPPPNPRRK